MVYTWAKNYVKHDGHDVEPVQIFLSANGGSGKSYLVKVRTLLYHCKDPEKSGVLLLGPTEVEPPFILVFQLNQEQSYLV